MIYMCSQENIHETDTVFRWSCFDTAHSFVFETNAVVGSEYQNAEDADVKIKQEDGNYAFDIRRNVEKKIYGLYGGYNGAWLVTPGLWDKNRSDLIGCVTILDWNWFDYTEEEPFTDENVLHCLLNEVEEFFGVVS
jgi:hypothetical protein